MNLWLDGALIDAASARIDPADRGLLLGDGVFETLPAHAGRPHLLAEHMARMRHGAAVLGIPFAATDDEIATAIAALLAANGLGREAAALRITLTRGPGPRGLLPPPTPRPTLMISAAPAAPPPSPARAIIATPRRNEASPTSTIKCLAYLDNILARREAAAQGADDALMLNVAGHLACASAANLFAVIDGKLITPPASDGVLAGITRRTILDLAATLDIEAREQSLDPADLRGASEAFLTNSLIGVRPLLAVDGANIGGGVPGRLTQSLATAYRDATTH